MAEQNRLDNGDPFPQLTAPRVGGDTMTLPGEIEGKWAVVVFYRGNF